MSVDRGISAGPHKPRGAVFDQEVALGTLEVLNGSKVCYEDLPTFYSEVVWLNIFVEMLSFVYFEQCVEHLHGYLSYDNFIVDTNILLFSDVLIN